MKPEELVEKMAEATSKQWNHPAFPESVKTSDRNMARKMFRVVLKHIQEGEVVSVKVEYMGENTILKPDFQKFMEEK